MISRRSAAVLEAEAQAVAVVLVVDRVATIVDDEMPVRRGVVPVRDDEVRGRTSIVVAALACLYLDDVVVIAVLLESTAAPAGRRLVATQWLAFRLGIFSSWNPKNQG